MSSLSMRELLEAGAHFGHQTRFWSPKMSQYIFGSRNKIHIINLEKTVAKFDEAAKFLTNLAAQKGTILFVGTKRTSRDAIVAEAKRAGMPYVDQRWKRLSAVACTTSTPAGWAVCSPTSRRLRFP